jgi:hypothetical protein
MVKTFKINDRIFWLYEFEFEGKPYCSRAEFFTKEEAEKAQENKLNNLIKSRKVLLKNKNQYSLFGV